MPELNRALVPSTIQHGFRPRHSTITALLPVTTLVAQGFNTPKPAARTGHLSADLSKAFDVVDRVKLLRKVNATDFHPNLKRFLASYSRDRKFKVKYKEAVSKWRKSKVGVFQGAPMSLGLFNFFTSDWEPESKEEEVDNAFADDIHGAASNPDTTVVADSLNEKAGELAAWAENNGMTISAQKSSITLFTPWTKQSTRPFPSSSRVRWYRWRSTQSYWE